jgi:hypothetical protein
MRLEGRHAGAWGRGSAVGLLAAAGLAAATPARLVLDTYFRDEHRRPRRTRRQRFQRRRLPRGRLDRNGNGFRRAAFGQQQLPHCVQRRRRRRDDGRRRRAESAARGGRRLHLRSPGTIPQRRGRERRQPRVLLDPDGRRRPGREPARNGDTGVQPACEIRKSET